MRPSIPAILDQHVSMAAHLRELRSIQVRAPHVGMLQLARIDERLAAHLDGISVAGENGIAACHAALDPPGAGAVFAAGVLAIQARDAPRLKALLAIAATQATARRGMLSALGWVSASSLRGIIAPLLASDDPWWREAAFAACAMHRADPGRAELNKALDANADARAVRYALQVVSSLGQTAWRDQCVDLARSASTASDGVNDALAADAARTAALLGDRGAALDVLRNAAADKAGPNEAALELLLKTIGAAESIALLKTLHAQPDRIRPLIRATGIAGDPQLVPWLIGQMSNPALARCAAEAFSFVTGADLPSLGLDRKTPDNAETGPNDDPQDDNVALDPDDNLPWPDSEKVAAWWSEHQGDFRPGQRYFLGLPPSFAHCASVLRTGTQRQRRHAAEYACLLRSGTPHFNIAAPAWRQARLLAEGG